MLLRQRGRGRALYEEIKSGVLDGTYAAGTIYEIIRPEISVFLNF